MLSRWVRTWDVKLLRPFLLRLASVGVTPNGLTLASLLLVVIAGLALARGDLLVGGIVFLLGVALDGIDGELARVMHAESPLGALLDSLSDHCGDYAICLGLLWLMLERGEPVVVVLIFLALFGSMFGSQIRSRAGMVGIDSKDVGLFSRFERSLVLAAGIFADQFLLAFAVLALINNLSAAQRLLHIIRTARQA